MVYFSFMLYSQTIFLWVQYLFLVSRGLSWLHGYIFWWKKHFIALLSRPLDYSINSYWINYWISFLVIFILLNKNFKKLFLFLMNKILGYLTIYSIILFFIIQLISLKIFRARSAREWIFIKRKKKFPKKPISELGTPPLKLNLPLL